MLFVQLIIISGQVNQLSSELTMLFVQLIFFSGQVNQLSSELTMLPKFALLAAAFISYLSGASEDVRQRKLTEWCEKLNVPPPFDFCRFLSTESEQLQWKAEGLPSDSLSIENALVILQVNCCGISVNVSPIHLAVV